MTGSTKLAIWVTAGFLAGGGAGYLVARSTITAKIQASADEEIASVVQKFSKDKEEIELMVRQELLDEAVRLQNEVDDAEDRATETTEDKVEARRVKLLPYQEKLLQQGYLVADDEGHLPGERVLVEAMALDPEPIGDSPSAQDIRKTVDVTTWERHVNEAYVISIDEWGEDYKNHEKLMLEYYEEDGALCDDREKLIADNEVQGLVGKLTLSRFGIGSDDKDIVYVRNCKQGVDFEITRNAGSYSKLVLGIDNWHADDDAAKLPILKMRTNE